MSMACIHMSVDSSRNFYECLRHLNEFPSAFSREQAVFTQLGTGHGNAFSRHFKQTTGYVWAISNEFIETSGPRLKRRSGDTIGTSEELIGMSSEFSIYFNEFSRQFNECRLALPRSPTLTPKNAC